MAKLYRYKPRYDFLNTTYFCGMIYIYFIHVYIYKFNLPLIAGFPRVACDVEIDNGGKRVFEMGIVFTRLQGTLVWCQKS